MNTPIALWAIADSADMKLSWRKTEGKNFEFIGNSEKEVRIGPWPVDFPRRIESDFCTDSRAGAFFKLRKQLWCYLYAGEGMLVALFFNAKETTLKTEEIRKFATGNLQDTYEKIGTALKAAFVYNREKLEWEEMSGAGDLVKGQQAEAVVQPQSGAVACAGTADLF